MSTAYPSCIAIAKYWYNKTDCPFSVTIDEPACFACRYYRESWGDKWERSGLERSHIIARSIGGNNDTPENFVLLCKSCHVDAPMTNKSSLMLQWIGTREHWINRKCREFMDEFVHMGGTIDDLSKVTAKSFMDTVRSLEADSHTHGRGGASGMLAVIALETIRRKKEDMTK